MTEYSILDILKIVLKRFWLVAIVGVLCACIAFMYCIMIATPTYEAKASILGSNGNVAADMELDISSGANDTSIKSSDLAASLTLTETYVQMLTKMPTESTAFVESIKKAGLVEQFNAAAVNISAREDTLIIDITVVSTDREAARQIANLYAECSSDFISDYNIGMIKELAKARSTSQVSPHTTVTTVLAFMFGVIITALIAIYFAVSDRTINGEDDIKSHYDIPLLGSVPDFQSTAKGAKKRG